MWETDKKRHILFFFDKQRLVELRCVLLYLLTDGEKGKWRQQLFPCTHFVITSHDNILHCRFACQTVHPCLLNDIFMEHTEWVDSDALLC